MLPRRTSPAPLDPVRPSSPSPPDDPVALHAPGSLRAMLVDGLSSGGLSVHDPWDEVAAGAPVVAVWGRQPPAHATDPWLRDPRPHLLVTVSAQCIAVGPFVDPGQTACLRCLEADGALSRGLAGPPRGTRGPSHRPLAQDIAGLARLAGAVAAHDVGRWLAGRTPATWSATVVIGADLRVNRRPWLRHPHCGCSWGLEVTGSG